MKVCHITSAHAWKDNRIFNKECRTLVDAGYEVELLCPGDGDREEDGVQVRTVPLPAGRMERMRKTTRRLYEKALELDAHLYHFHDPEFLPFAKKLVKKGKTVLYDAHEDLPRQILSKEWIPKGFRGLVAGLVQRYEKGISARLSGIVTATDTIADRFRGRGVAVTAVKNFPRLKDLPAPDPGKGTIDERPFQLCYLGGISRNRGIVELLRAMERLDGVHLALAGPFQPAELQHELEDMKGWERVTYHGVLDRQGVVEVLENSRIGVVTLHPVPNYREALPVKMFEYMGAGLPVLASDFPSWKGIVENENCGVCVDPLDPDAIADAVKALMIDPERARQMGSNGRKAVERTYNWEHEKEKLLELYRNITAS